jgi:hypothetical protein
MKIPVYERQADIKAPSFTRPTAAAAGTDVLEAQAKQAEAVGKIAGVVSEHAIKLQEVETHKKILEADTAFRTELQNTLYDPAEDENGMPKGLLVRTKEGARGTSKAFDLTVEDLKQKYAKTLPGGVQANFIKLADNSAVQHRDNVIRNEATQIRVAFNDSVKANIEQRMSDVANAPDANAALSGAMGAASIMEQSARRNGDRPEVAKLAGQDVLTKSVLNYIGTHAESDYEGSKALYEKVKTQLSAEGQMSGEKLLKGAGLVNLQAEAWNTVKGLRLSDGNPDEAAMVAELDKLNLKPEEKDHVSGYIRAKAGEMRMQITQAKAANTNEFMNELYTARQNGQSYDEASKLVGKYGVDAYDSGLKQELVKKLYTAPDEAHVGVYMDLWERIQDKDAKQEDIDEALKRGELSPSEWKGLRMDFYKAQAEGVKVDDKNVKERIDLELTKRFGSNKKKKDEIAYSILLAIRDKSPEEAWKIANDQLEKTGGKDIVMPFFGKIGSVGGKPLYEVEGKKRDALALAKGKMQEDIGDDETDAILGSVGVSGIEDFARQLGGYESLKKGTAANKAIQYLVKKRKKDPSVPVTPANVNAVIRHFNFGAK